MISSRGAIYSENKKVQGPNLAEPHRTNILVDKESYRGQYIEDDL